jgi:hypothetical protein
MSDNAFVTPLWRSLPSHARKQVQDGVQKTPKAIPVSVVSVQGELVTVKVEAQGNYTIEQFQVAQGYSEWMRGATQVGDKGYVTAADFYIGGMTGLGGGTADYRDRANLTPMVFFPVSQKTFPHNPTRDFNALFLNGMTGTVNQDTGGKSVHTVHPTNGITSTTQTGNVTHNSGQSIVATAQQNISHTAQQSITHEAMNGNVSISAAKGVLALLAKTLSLPAGGVSAGSLASGAASSNVGALGGDLSGELPNPNVVGITHVNASALQGFASNADAKAAGLTAGQLYINFTISATEFIICVVH